MWGGRVGGAGRYKTLGQEEPFKIMLSNAIISQKGKRLTAKQDLECRSPDSQLTLYRQVLIGAEKSYPGA